MNIRATLSQIGRLDDTSIHVIDAALTLSCWANPKLSQAPYQRHIQTLVNDARAYVGADGHDVERVLEAARQIIARRYGYAGEIEPSACADGANLACVIDKRRGGALALCILYAHVLESLGQRVEILDFTARPLVRVLGPHNHCVLDPCEDGRTLNARHLRHLHKAHAGTSDELAPFHLMAFSNRQILIHLQDDTKAFHLRHAAPETALAALEAALLIAPKIARLWREVGLLHARLDHINEAISALEQFLQLPGGTAYRYTASQLLQQLHTRKDQKLP